jgi:hypothetical protein
VAVAATSLVGGWSAPAQAGTVAPSVQALCNVIDGTPAVSGRLVDFPPNQDLLSLFVMQGPKNGRTFTFSITIGTDTDAQGTATTPGGSSSGITFHGFPIDVGWIVYRDRNGNVRWDEGVDETLYRGDGTVTACPQTVTLSPK